MPRGAKPLDLSGKRFGLLTAESIEGRDARRNVFWKCVCSCGNNVLVRATDLKSWHTQSCGCMKVASLKERVTKHGSSKTRLYFIWQQMLSRCYNQNNKSYKFYGGRGISVCEEWRTSFDRFAIDMGDPEEGMSLERINNETGYSKENCKWANKIEQMNNRRNNVLIEHSGRSVTMANFAREIGFPYAKVRSAVNRGVRNISGIEIKVTRMNDSSKPT